MASPFCCYSGKNSVEVGGVSEECEGREAMSSRTSGINPSERDAFNRNGTLSGSIYRSSVASGISCP